MIDDVVRRCAKGRGIEIDLSTLPLDDRATYRLVAKGDAVGVFQMESRRHAQAADPAAADAPSRTSSPSSPSTGRARSTVGMVDAVHQAQARQGADQVPPSRRSSRSCKDTYGVIVYQEQVMQIAQVLAGYSLGDADNLRRAMGKKKKPKMDEGARALRRRRHERQNISEKLAGEIFDQMETFAAYGFNKSHSAAYALVSYQTAYLKAHYPEEFMAGLMTLEMGDTDKTYKNIAECRERGMPHPAAGRQREPRRLHRPRQRPTTRARARSVSAWAPCGGSAQGDRGDHRRAPRRPVPIARRLLQTRAGPAGEQAGRREPDQVRRASTAPKQPRRRMLDGLERASSGRPRAIAQKIRTRWACSLPARLAAAPGSRRRCPTCRSGNPRSC